MQCSEAAFCEHKTKVTALERLLSLFVFLIKAKKSIKTVFLSKTVFQLLVFVITNKGSGIKSGLQKALAKLLSFNQKCH